MYFKSVRLENFRNYKDLFLEFDPGLNIFLGRNAQGKTNLLESLFIMGLGKSFRTSKDREMIAFESDFSKAVCIVADEDRETELKVVYKKEGKIISVDGVKLARTVDLLENVYIVVFSPEDLRIIKDGPDNRRRFLDRELCQIKPVYYSDLGNYKKILKQRNFILRQPQPDRELLSVFDEALTDYGIRIADERSDFTERLMDISRDIHSKISSGSELLKVSYETDIPGKDIESQERKELYRRKLEENYERDSYNGFTSFGPHKDDLKLEINGTDIRMYGSQGQQRTAALSMKLAEIELIKQETGKNAVLLLDDVLSELDQGRQQYLIEAMKDIQVFITATEIDSEMMSRLPKGRKFIIDGGSAKLLT